MTRCTLTGFVSTARSVRTLWVLGTMIVLSATHVRSDTQELSNPRQIHMAHGEDAMSRHITWVTDVAASTQVWYGYDANCLVLHQSGHSTSLPDVEETYIHHTHLWELKQNTTYYWKIKGDTRVFTFRTDGGKETTELPSTLIYADPSPFSVTHASIAARITSTSTVIHVGDVDNNRFMNGIESVASHVPYMMGVGEHDVDNPLISQFWMPETDGIKQLWYSWNAGGVHYISLPTPLVINTTSAPIILDWLSHDLIHASHPNVRTFYPFVVIYMSEPSHMEIIQPYLQYVDLVISSHDAPYKRSKHEIINIALDTHVRDHDGKKMMADVVPSYGYIKAINATHMEYQQIASTSGIVLDHVWIYANTTRAA